eukprot:Nk52_evm30s96 gene=Nk52_evmTU30s96
MDRPSELAHWTVAKASRKAKEIHKEIYDPDIPEEYVIKEVKVKVDTGWVRWDHDFHEYIHKFTNHSFFNVIIMIVIITNALTMAVETGTPEGKRQLFEIADYVYLGVYTAEFCLKIYAEPKGYWASGYNRFDFFILIVSFGQVAIDAQGDAIDIDLAFLRVIRALRALRALRSVSFIRSLQVLVAALMSTFQNAVLDLILLLSLVMYLFAIMGYYFFGFEDNGDKTYWGNLGVCFLSLFTYVTADGWTDIQDSLNEKGFKNSQWFSIVFIFFGHFIWTNLFIGLIIQNIERATREDKEHMTNLRLEIINSKKEKILARQTAEIQNMLNQSREKGRKVPSIEDAIQDIAKTLSHKDVVPMTYLACNLAWLDTFMLSLNYQENNKFRVQQLHFELSNILAQIGEGQILKMERMS